MRRGNPFQPDCGDEGAAANLVAERVIKSFDAQTALAVSVLGEPLTEHARQPFASQARRDTGVARGRDSENDMRGLLRSPWQLEAQSRRQEVSRVSDTGVLRQRCTRARCYNSEPVGPMCSDIAAA